MTTTSPQVRWIRFAPVASRAFVIVVVACVLGAPALAIDSDGNGLDDIWEMVYGASGLTAGADTDHDGATNAQESAAGTNPFDPALASGTEHCPVVVSATATALFANRWKAVSRPVESHSLPSHVD